MLSSSPILKTISHYLTLFVFSIAHLIRFNSTYNFNMPPYSFYFSAVLFVIVFSRPLIHFILHIRFIRFKTLLISSYVFFLSRLFVVALLIRFVFMLFFSLILSCVLCFLLSCLSSSLFILFNLHFYLHKIYITNTT
jgi:hypothetical protein